MDIDFFKAMIIPLYAGSASLLIALINRNINVSERMRSITGEIIRSVCSDKRSENLARQSDIFWGRYLVNTAAITGIFASMLVYTLMFASAALSNSQPKPNFSAAAALFWLGGAITSVSFVLVLVDFWRSAQSLGHEKEHATLVHRERAAAEAVTGRRYRKVSAGRFL